MSYPKVTSIVKTTDRRFKVDGWLLPRIFALILVKYDHGESWDSAQVLACAGLLDGEWRNMLHE
ncbi:MAG: hypothetical protein WA996_12190 [Candidatus Promineifilaceae bacterium]